MARTPGGTLSAFTLLSTPDAPTDLSVNPRIGSATVSFTAPTDTGDAAVTSYIVTAVNESTGESTGATGSASPITVSPGGGTFKIRAQAINAFGPGRLTEFSTGNVIFSGAALYSWGQNNNGQLGQNNIINGVSSPVQVGALTDWNQIDAGSFHTAAVTQSGTLFTWGRNSGGQLGLGNTVYRSSPVQVGALTNWAQVSAGGSHTACVKTDGTLFAWGNNFAGKLGLGNVADRSSPVQVGALTNWSYVSAGGNFTVCVKTNGTIFAWGSNSSGELGLGNVVNRSSPVQVGALTNWAQATAGNEHTVCVKTDGTLFAWGSNTDGKLGLNLNPGGNNRSSPVQVGALTNWSQASAGSNFTACVKTDSTLFTWGNNQSGQLGLNINYAISHSSPVQVGSLTNWEQVAAGNDHAACVKTNGTLFAWGKNDYGQLGLGNAFGTNRSSPVQVGSLTSWAQVSAGSQHTVARIGAP